MTVLPWASPEVLGRCTLTQLICQTRAKPGKSATTAEDLLAMQGRHAAARADRERAWNERVDG